MPGATDDFVQRHVAPERRARVGLQALLAEALHADAPDGCTRLRFQSYRLIPMSRRRLGVEVRVAVERSGPLAPPAGWEGRVLVMVLPDDGPVEEVEAAAQEACGARARILEAALARIPPSWRGEVLPEQLLGLRPCEW